MTEGRFIKWALVAPTLIFLIAMNLFPLVYNVTLSFTNADLSRPEKRTSVQTKNYDRLFDPEKSEDQRSALRNTASFVICAVSIELVLGFIVALALHRVGWGKSIWMTILIIPMMLSPAVIGMFWNHILDAQHGILNQLLGALHLPQPRWTTDKSIQFWTIVLIDVWMWTPFMMLISLAALGSIPKSIYEAAEIDRGGAWYVFRRVTLPMCAPLLILAVLLRVTDALKQFDLVMAITGPTNSSTRTLSTQMYQEMIQSGRIGRGSAFSLVVLVIVIALATLFTRYMAYLKRSQGRAD